MDLQWRTGAVIMWLTKVPKGPMSSEKHPGSDPDRKTRRLAQVRRWHTWAGLGAGLLLLFSGTTGILLNYKQPIFAKLGVELKRGERDATPLPVSKSPNKVRFTTDAGISGGAVDFAGALALAQQRWGDVALERVELRAERGLVSYRFRKSGGAELWIDAADGTCLAKGEYERLGKAGAEGSPSQSTDWGRLLIDLHTGKIGGQAGRAVMSCGGLVLVLLVVSGVYMWVKPILGKRERARDKERKQIEELAGPVQTVGQLVNY